jgi:hypothetical protein
MRPNDAVALDNWFPKTSYCEIRGGYASHLIGLSQVGKTLAVYNAMSGTSKMFVATSAGIYDASISGAAGAAVLVRTNGKHQCVMFGDGTSNYLIMCNGVDKPAYYDGAAWTAVDNATTPALSGVTSSNLIQPMVFKGRLFFIEKTSLSFWYLAAGAAGGALTEFDLSAEAYMGGYLMAMATWTYDGGDGADDRAVFVTSEGQVLVYAGNNPSSATAWAKVGTYFLGKPLGRRCFTKLGGDLVLITQNGAFPLSKALQSSSIDFRDALSNKIETAFNTSARSYGTNFGWEAVVFPAQAALLVNIPIAEDGEHEQYVMNTITKAWCKFKEWDAETFALFNAELYFCTSTSVMKAWTGAIDGANNIEVYGKSAFTALAGEGQKIRVMMYQPILAVNGNISFLTDIDVDFQDEVISGQASYSVTSGARWDIDSWDEASWAAGLEVTKAWTSPDEYGGTFISGKLKIATNSLTVQWMANTYMYKREGILA